MSTVWDTLKPDAYLSLQPWVWIQLESAESPGPLPFVGGVAPEVVAALHEAHAMLLSAVETMISDVFAHRAPLDDPKRRILLEDAYAELVNSRPHLKAHISCGRRPDGTFEWSYSKDPTKSATMSYAGLRIFNAVARQAMPMPFDRPIAPQVGTFIGMLSGRHTVAEIRTIATTLGKDVGRFLTQLLEVLKKYECLATSATSSVTAQWSSATEDQDLVHLGHAALLYRHREQFLLFDPWLMPWYAEMPVPSLWTSLLPKPAAIFLTHDHDDHVDPRTLYHMPKDVPIIVPSRRNRRELFYDYRSLLRELGFTQIIELAHGESWKMDGGEVVSGPFYGEDPCDIEMPRNCYLITDRGRNILVHADSGPTNAGRSPLKDGVIAGLVQKYGPIDIVLASQQQLKEIRSYAAHACLAHPGTWLDVGENGFLTNDYLAELCRVAQAKLFVSYATGGAEWYPDHLSFMFSDQNPARTKLLTGNWEPPLELAGRLDAQYRRSKALTAFRVASGHLTESSVTEALSPMAQYSLVHGGPPFARPGGRGQVPH